MNIIITKVQKIGVEYVKQVKDNRPLINKLAARSKAKILSLIHIFRNGSEHAFNNIPYTAEVHLVFYNSKYANAKIASNKKDGLTVVAFLYQVIIHSTSP